MCQYWFIHRGNCTVLIYDVSNSKNDTGIWDLCAVFAFFCKFKTLKIKITEVINNIFDKLKIMFKRMPEVISTRNKALETQQYHSATCELPEVAFF